MKHSDQQDFTNRHPHVGFRTNPDVKKMLLELQKENGGTLSDTVENVVVNGLNSMCPTSSNSDSPIAFDDDVRQELEQFDGYIQGIKDKAQHKGFSEGYEQCAIETQKKINGALNGFKDDDDDETFECADCGAEIVEGDTFCGNCKKEIDWSAFNDDDDDQEEDGILSGIINSINDIFDGIFGSSPTSNNDDSDDLTFAGGNNTPNKTSDNDDEENLECGSCGAEITEDDDHCPDCGLELDWDNENGGEKKGLLDGLKKWNNGG